MRAKYSSTSKTLKKPIKKNQASSDEDFESDEDEDQDEPEEEEPEEEEESSSVEEDDEPAKKKAKRVKQPAGESMERPCKIQVSSKHVPVPSPEPFHRDWSVWNKYLEEYKASTHQVLAIQYTTNVSNHNKRSKIPVPEALGPYQRVYICTHGQPLRSRGAGVRPKRMRCGIDCPFTFRVQLACVEGSWKLVVHDGCMWHNHRLGKEVYSTYPKSRGIVDPQTRAKALEMDDWGLPRSQIYDMCLRQGENVYRSDVNNLVSAHRGRDQLLNDDQAALQVVEDFISHDDGAIATVDETQEGKTGVISLTTRHMREMLERFGELLMVDCTHKTNS
jgi:hypothetical protein